MANYGAGVGSVGAADAAVLALLADTSRAGRGGMYGGGYGGGYGEGGYGGYGGHGPFGGPASNAVRIDRNNETAQRNGQDAHFFDLSNQARSDFNLLNLQQQNNMLATQQQISQLALQLCECCGDNKAVLGRIEGRLDCLEKDVGHEINIAINKQTIADLRDQIANSNGNGNGNGWPPWFAAMPTAGPPYGPPNGRNGVTT